MGSPISPILDELVMDYMVLDISTENSLRSSGNGLPSSKKLIDNLLLVLHKDNADKMSFRMFNVINSNICTILLCNRIQLLYILSFLDMYRFIETQIIVL